MPIKMLQEKEEEGEGPFSLCLHGEGQSDSHQGLILIFVFRGHACLPHGDAMRFYLQIRRL